MKKIGLSGIKDLSKARSEVSFIDIRSKEECKLNFIPGFKHIPFETLDIYLAKKQTRKKIVLLCEDGERSVYAAKMLSNILSGTEFYIIENGIQTLLK